MTAYAHSKEGCPHEEWQTLHEHLLRVANDASRYASFFGGGELAKLAGLWHDFGKYAPDWQQFLFDAQAGSTREDASVLGDDTPDERRTTRRRGPDHSTAGAIQARRTIANAAVRKTIEFVVAAHHGGLADRSDLDRRLTDPEKISRYEGLLRGVDPAVVATNAPSDVPPFVHRSGAQDGARAFEFFVRMIFSAVVDADFIDTERFLDVTGARTSNRSEWLLLSEYIRPLEAHLQDLGARAT
ncbi:MAG TPA: CRISPR-associated endonuclease Cas3'', partial [Thermoanaerobaculia bacterium]|nr:CRISPR-associated endonuclease Cas3'' [Thermoanaerobaculia bacterium]